VNLWGKILLFTEEFQVKINVECRLFVSFNVLFNNHLWIL